MRTVTRWGIVFALCAAWAIPADAEEPMSITLGLRTGSTTNDILDSFEDTAAHFGPLAELRYGDFSLGLAFLWAKYEDEGSVSLPDSLQQALGGNIPPVPTRGETTRYDFDVSLRYRVPADLPITITPFIGYRKEVFADTTLAPTNLEQLRPLLANLPGNAGFALDTDIELDFVAVGASFAYPIEEAGLVPFFIVTAFPYVAIEEIDETFPGYALEGGFAYLLGKHFDLPLYVTASVKFQSIEADDGLDVFDEQIFPGATSILPTEESFFNSNFAIYYRFDLN